MRPVDKPHPNDSAGNPKTFAKYGDAKPDLLRQLGEYCSYCEMELKDGHEVEHVQPKSREPALLTAWSNFLLACKRCNTRKGSDPVHLDDFVWPDRDNTFLAFEYRADNRVVVATGLTGQNRERAQKLLELVGLDNQPVDLFDDPRYDQRSKAWAKAQETRNDIWRAKPEHRDITRKKAADYAKIAGHFSVWMAVFENDSEMRRLLIAAFDGTSLDCFDSDGAPISRVGGKL